MTQFSVYSQILKGQVTIVQIFSYLVAYFLSSIIINLNSMNILGKVKHMLKASDFFYSTEMLRYDQEMQYRTLTGGIFSLGIIITICIGFASMILDTLNLSSISTTIQVLNQIDPAATNIKVGQESKFMFAVELWGLNLSDSTRYFDITLTETQQSNGNIYFTRNIPLQACTKQHWSSYPYVTERFDTLNSQEWLCPPQGTNINIYGKYSSANYSHYKIQASACKNETDPLRPCRPFGQIQKYFIDNQNFLYFTLFFGNVIINSDQKEYKQYYLEDKIYAIMGSNIGSRTLLQFSDYHIETDSSIWPFSSIANDIGTIVADPPIRHPYQTNINGTYVQMFLTKSTNSFVYKREVQKISSVFSFMGGMIGAVSAVLFIIKLYTNFSFEISIAHELFEDNQEQRGQKKKGVKDRKEKQEKGQRRDENSMRAEMNFCEFFQYHFYSAMKTLGKDLEWPKMRFLNECEKEVLKQLDVKALLKRVIFIEYCLTMIFEDYQLSGLQQNIPKTLAEIKGIRQKCASVIDSDILTQEVEKQLSINLASNSSNSFGKFALNSPQILSANENFHSPSMSRSIIQGQIMGLISNDIEIADMGNEKQLRHNRNQVVNIFPLQNKMKKYLKALKKDVRKGNRMSQRIWINLKQSQKVNEAEIIEDCCK